MKYYIERITSNIAALIFLQTLYFKFFGAPESVYIFSKLGLEPYGRIGIGIVELCTALLLIVRKTSWIGAVIGIVIISVAILSHIFILGIVVQNDHGLLLILAMTVFACCFISIYLQKEKLRFLK